MTTLAVAGSVPNILARAVLGGTFIAIAELRILVGPKGVRHGFEQLGGFVALPALFVGRRVGVLLVLAAWDGHPRQALPQCRSSRPSARLQPDDQHAASLAK
jgi:hypothetical protein